MKIALLSGAVKNAGDYLITRRTKDLLKTVIPDSEIKVMVRNMPFHGSRLEKLNEAELALIGGGPVYRWNLYPDRMPLAGDALSMVKPRLAILGGGWYGSNCDIEEVWKYKFSETTKKLLQRAVRDTGKLGCRDYYAMRVLISNDINDAVMTGCPAWYDIDKIGKRLDKMPEIRKIAVSDPADVKHYGEQSIRVCEYLKKRYPGAELLYIFHRGTKVDAYTDQETVNVIDGMKPRLLAMGYTIHDIASGYQGFHHYDDCDLHVGHRVHAHIYNLSERHASILIEEDARGAGVNEPLGLWGIRAYSRKTGMNSSVFVKAYNKVFDYTRENTNVIQELEAGLDELDTMGLISMNQAYAKMEFFFDRMTEHIRSFVQ